MSCGHAPVTREALEDVALIRCKACGHHWREWTGGLTHEEYDSVVLMLAAYHLGRGRPDSPAQT